MKIKTLNKNLIILLTMLTMLMSVFMLSACGKKDPEEKPFEAKTLTVEQAQTVLNEAVAKAKQATNLYYELEVENDDSSWGYVTTDAWYEESTPARELAWYLYESDKWITYLALLNGETGEYGYYCRDDVITTTATTGLELFIEEYDDIFDVQITAGTQTAQDIYTLTSVLEDPDGSFVINIEIVDGYIKSATGSQVGSTLEQTITFEYNVEDLEIPQLPDVEWIER